MPVVPKNATKSDAAAYLESRGWTPSPYNNSWRREKSTPQEDGSVRVVVLEGPTLEPEAIAAQQARDIGALLSRVDALEAKAATVDALAARMAALESGLGVGVQAPAPVAPAIPSKPALAPSTKGAR